MRKRETKPASGIDWAVVRQRLEQSRQALEHRAAEIDDQRLAAVFRERAQRLAARQARAAEGQSTTVLTFCLSEGKYALPLANVLQVSAQARSTTVPGGPLELVGVALLRGEIRSVVSLARLLQLPDTPTSRGDYLLVVRHGRQEVGFQVDGLDGVRSLRADDLRAPESNGLPLQARFVRGVGPEKLVVLDTEAIFSHPLFG